MAKFHSVTVADIYKETKDCSVITFDIPESIQAEFQYKPGQHLALRTQINGQEVRRSYSLCSSPLEHKWQVAVKQIQDGLFSTFVNESLKVGDVLDVMPPSGLFYTEVESTKAKNYIAFAAGSGITPILLSLIHI
jgi:ring-1,2-phenylacetyl-CoA epoxidase subunit PaaE